MAKSKNQAMEQSVSSATLHPKTAGEPAGDRFAPGELPRRGNAEPSAIRTIIKLDQRSMVWAYEGVATDAEALSPFISLIAVGTVGGCLWAMWDTAFSGVSDDGSLFERAALFVMCLVIAVCGVGFVIYTLKNSVFSAFGDVHFNRFSKTIYTSENGKSVRMKWDNIRPFAVASFGAPQFGAPIMMSLQLVEFASTESRTPIASFVVAGPLPNRQGCQEVWELIRRYMEDPPERVPPLEVVTSDRDWVSVLLTFGPMSFGTIPQEFLAKLRARNWWPPINPIHIFWWVVAWYFPLSVTLYNKYRRREKLPVEWICDETPPSSEMNPYQNVARDSREVAARRRAAWIIGLVSGLCVLTGIGLWGLGAKIILGE